MQKLKIKVNPQDFIVEEIAKLQLKEKGDFAIYRLEKKNCSTLEVLYELAKELKIPFNAFSYGGRKDKHAITFQYISIRHTKPQDIKGKDYALSFTGFMDRPMGPDLISGNRFEIAIRGLSDNEAAVSRKEIELVKAEGLANYFDDQRFGSFDEKQGFIAEKIIKKQYNGALKIYLTHVSSEDKKEDKERKNFFFKYWGNWDECYTRAKTTLEKSAFMFLKKNPKGFLLLLQRIPRQDLSLFFSCFQSFLWNKLLRRIVKEKCTGNLKMYEGLAGNYIFCTLPLSQEPYLRNLTLPTVSAKTKMPDAFAEAIYNSILKENGIKPSMFNLRQMRQAFFKAHLRPATIIPERLSFEFLDDEVYRGSKKLILKFILPRASYATMLIKRIFSEPFLL